MDFTNNTEQMYTLFTHRNSPSVNNDGDSEVIEYVQHTHTHTRNCEWAAETYNHPDPRSLIGENESLSLTPSWCRADWRIIPVPHGHVSPVNRRRHRRHPQQPPADRGCWAQWWTSLPGAVLEIAQKTSGTGIGIFVRDNPTETITPSWPRGLWGCPGRWPPQRVYPYCWRWKSGWDIRGVCVFRDCNSWMERIHRGRPRLRRSSRNRLVEETHEENQGATMIY